MKSIYCCLVLAILLATFEAKQQEPKLIFVQEVFRHGARNPFNVMGIGDEYVEEENRKGELTKQGKSMHFVLGGIMKQTYWDRLFGKAPFDANYFYIRSTDVNRTIESAMSHLAGLLKDVPPLFVPKQEVKISSPPYLGARAHQGYLFGKTLEAYQPLAIHNMDNVMTVCNSGQPLIRFMSYNCPLQSVWQQENLKIPKYRKMLKHPEFKNMMEVLSQQLGKTVTPANFNQFYDSLESMRFRGKTVPSVFTDDSQTSRTLHLYYALRQAIIFYGNQTQLKASANDILGQTIHNMRNIVDNPSVARKWILYSAHDITLGFILNQLQMSNPECIYDVFLNKVKKSDSCIQEFPPYASVMVFQLYQYETGEVTFKINYNGEHRKIPICGKEQCSLEELEDWYESWRVSDVKPLCMQREDFAKAIEKIQAQISFELQRPGECMHMIREELEQPDEEEDL